MTTHLGKYINSHTGTARKQTEMGDLHNKSLFRWQIWNHLYFVFWVLEEASLMLIYPRNLGFRTTN